MIIIMIDIKKNFIGMKQSDGMVPPNRWNVAPVPPKEKEKEKENGGA